MRNSRRILTLSVLLIALAVATLCLNSCDLVNDLIGGQHTCEYAEVVDSAYLKSEATCTSAAVYYKSCSCGEVGTETFTSGEPAAHAYTQEAKEAALKSEATCTAAAVYYESCSSCGANGTATFTSGEPLGHSHTQSITAEALKSEATCTSAAVYYKTCSLCGTIGPDTFTHGAPASHNYVEEVKDSAFKCEATCTSGALYYETCADCGVNGSKTFEVGEPTSHSVTHVPAKDATETEDGNLEYWVCSVCDNYFSDANAENVIADKSDVFLPSVGHVHDFTEKNVTDEYIVTAATCTESAVYNYSCACGEKGTETFTHGDTIDHVYVENAKDEYKLSDATCQSLAVYCTSCSSCGVKGSDTFTYGDLLDHSYAEVVANKYLVSGATCQALAVYNKSCSVCGEAGNETFTAGELGDHEYTSVVDDKYLKSEATCISSAVYNKSCSVCGEAGSSTFEAGALAAHAGVHKAAVAATCETSGLLEHWQCSNCGKYFSDEACLNEVAYTALVVTTGHNYVENTDHEYLLYAASCESGTVYYKSCEHCGEASSETFVYGSALDHNYLTVTKVEATCQNGGYTLLKCTYCNGEKKENETAKLDHVIETEIVTEPSCGVAGQNREYCSNGCGYEKEIVVAAPEHDYAEVDTAPTCETAGYTTYTCTACGDSYIGDTTEAIGHNYAELIESKDASCTENGYTTYKCTNDGCDATSTTTVDATGHNPVAATCTADAYCSACGETLTDKKLGHQWNDVKEVKATCTTDGYLKQVCGVCGEENLITDNYLATGHNESAIEWTETNVPVEGEACLFRTVRSGVCPDCGETISINGNQEVIHSYEAKITTEANCMADGIKTYTCTACGDSYEETYSAPDAHVYVDGACACGKTKTEIGGNEANVSDNLDSELEFNDASLSMDQKTQESLGGKDVNLSVGKVDQSTVDEMASSLTEEEKALLADKDVYNFEMYVDGENVTSFGGKITIKIPYTLAEGEDPDGIVVWYLAPQYDENGSAVYDENGAHVHVPTLVEAQYTEIDGTGYAVFETEHFSYYTVTKLTAKQRCEKFGHNHLVTDVIATCLGEGYTLEYCLRCGVKEFSNEVEPLGHDFVLDEDTYVEVSCSVDGYEYHYCSRCQVGFEVKTESAGHDWSSVSVTPATCNAAGCETFKCNTCDEERNITLPMLPHSYESVITEATCTTAGYTTKTCTSCGHTIVTDYVGPLGHKDNAKVHGSSCLEKGYTEHYCDRCDTVFNKDNYTDKSDHRWNADAPDCEHDKFCLDCKKLDDKAENKGHAKGHSYHGGKCDHCDNKCEHEHQKYSHDKAPTCGQDGYRMHICEDCLEFVHGEKIDRPDHDYKEVRFVPATCISPAYTVYKCHGCKEDHIVEEGEPIEHTYVGGVCSYCGKSNNSFYLNLIESMFTNNGFSLKVENFTLVYEELNNNSEWITEGYIQTVNVNELMLYYDEADGFTGAANISFVIFNGPVDGESTIEVKAIIEGGYAYIDMTSDVEEMNGSVRYSVDKFLESMLYDMFRISTEDLESVIPVLQDEVLPVLALLVESNEADIESVLATVFEMLFSYEVVNGEYVYTLDFDKLHALNENLATLTVSEVVDLYFGEGSFDSICDTVIEIMNLKVCDIPAYVAHLGIDEETLNAAINAVCKGMLGAPEDFYIEDVFASEEASEYTVGMLLMNGEYDEAVVRDSFEMLRGDTAYNLFIGEGEVSAQIGEIIDYIDEMIDLSFTTDKNGNILLYNVDVKDGVINSDDDERYTVNIDLSVMIGGVIDVDWENIVGDIDDKVTAIPERESESYTDSGEHGYSEGGMVYNDVWYDYQAQEFYLYKTVRDYSDIFGIAVANHCGDWVMYSVNCGYDRYEFNYSLRLLKAEDGSYIYLLVDSYENTVEIIPSETEEMFVTYIRPDGTTGTFKLDGNSFTEEQLVLCFGELEWNYHRSSTTGYYFFYNTVTGEVAEESQHSYVITDTKQSESCGVDGYYVYTCEHCGDSYKNYFNDFDHNFEIDYENSQPPVGCESSGYYVYVCTGCGESYKNYVNSWHNFQHVYTLMEGAESCNDGVICSYQCVECGRVEWENIQYGHAYESTYELVDGSIYYSSSCQVCGLTESSGFYCGFEGIDAELTIDSFDNGYLYITLIPAANGVYEIYSYGEYRGDPYVTLYDENENWLASDHDGGIDWNFGLLYELKAGVKYRLCVERCENTTICVKPHDDSADMTVYLSDYGCTCETGYVSLVKAFGTTRFDYVHDHNCNIDCNWGENYYADENCNQIGYTMIDIWDRSTGEAVAHFETEHYMTGRVSHNINSEWFNENGEITDEYGNLLTFNKDGHKNVCMNCGTVSYVYECVNYYNADGDHVKYEELYYHTNSESGELYLSNQRIYEYVYIVDAYGNKGQRTSCEAHFDYNAYGDVTYYNKYTYTYNGCETTRVHESSKGDNTTDTYYNHSTSEKELPDESGRIDNEDGSYVETITRERYCTVCAASLSKYSDAHTYDADGHLVEYVHTEYTSYAESEDVYGYYVSSVETHMYNNIEYAPGKYVSRTASVHYEDYDLEGNVIYWYNRDYVYYTNCEYDEIYTNSNGEEYTYSDCTAHNTYRDYRLHEGSVSCEDGVDVWYACMYCDYEYLSPEYLGYDHRINNYCDSQATIYNLADYGSECGGEVYVYSCACGERYSVNVNQECDFDYNSNCDYSDPDKVDHWIETRGCAVTHTADGYDPCGFVYTYETWIQVESDCRGTRYYRYTFGVGTDEPLVIEWSYSDGGYYHNTMFFDKDGQYYVENGYEVYVNEYEYICQRCGVKTQKSKQLYYIDENGSRVRYETETEYYTNLGILSQIVYDTYELFVDELFGNAEDKWIYHSYVYYDEAGNVTSANETYRDYAWVYNEDLTETRIVEILYEDRNYYSAESYESGVADHWWKNESDFSSCICQPTITYTDSNGEESVYTQEYYDHYSYTDYYWVVEPTCTQPGIEAYACRWCDYESSWNCSAFGHSYTWSEETQSYHCTRCYLENFTGYDGTIVLEDLTWKLGDGVNYAIGYYVGNGYSYEIYIGVMLGDGPDADSLLLNDYIEMNDTGSVLYVNIESLQSAIANMAAALGEDFNICTNMVRISFVPEYNDYEFDYAITLDPHVLSYTVDTNEDGKMPTSHSASCAICGETLKSGEMCEWVRTYYDTYVGEGNYTCSVSEYTCRHCGSSYRSTVWAELTADASSCFYTVYERLEWGDGQETVTEISSFEQHNYVYSFNENSVSAEAFDPQHSYKCSDCGDEQFFEMCDTWHVYAFSYVEDGVRKEANYHYCSGCGFAYKYVLYSLSMGNCTYVDYGHYYWNNNAGVYANSYTVNYGETIRHTYTSYVHVSEWDGVTVPVVHTAYCSECGIVEPYTCEFNTMSETKYVDGVEHHYVYHTCRLCGFEYTHDYYSVNVTDCEYTEYYVKSWYNENGEIESVTDTYTSVNHKNVYSYTVQEDGSVLRTYSCVCGSNSGGDTCVRMNSELDVELVAENDTYLFVYAFTPVCCSNYIFYSSNNSGDTYGYIYGANGNLIAQNDDGGDNNNFLMQVGIDGGQVYYFCARFYSDSPNGVIEGSFDIHIEAVE